MKTASYMLLHWPSESKVEVKFSIDNGQAKLKSVTFLQGNVFELSAFREVRRLVRARAAA